MLVITQESAHNRFEICKTQRECDTLLAMCWRSYDKSYYVVL